MFDALIYVAIMVPGIVIGISTLIALGDAVRRAQPGDRSLADRSGRRPSCSSGYGR